MIHGKLSFSLDLASFSLILAYSSKESCFAFFEVEDFSTIELLYQMIIEMCRYLKVELENRPTIICYSIALA